MKRYEGHEVTVTFDPTRCLHAAECVRGLPSVFDAQRRPWVTPDGAPAEQVSEVVQRCPSGALHFESAVVAPEEPRRPTSISARPNGPIWIRGDLTLETPEGELREVRAALCHCGATANAPFCDGSGPCSGWH